MAEPKKKKAWTRKKVKRVSGHFIAPDFETKSVIFLDLFHKAFQCTARSITRGPVKGWAEPGRNTAVANWSGCKKRQAQPPIYDRVLPQSYKALRHQTITDIILRSARGLKPKQPGSFCGASL